MTTPSRRARRWSSVDDLRTALRRRWDRGELLALIADRTWQPLRVPLRGPTAGELSSEFGLVQEWFDRLRRDASGPRAPAFRLETRSVGGRLVGANDLPCAAWFDTPEQVWRLLRVEGEVRAFEELYAATLAADPAVAAWVRSHPLPALKHAAEWPKLMATARWLAARVGAGAYLRQIDVPGVDTKFIERNRPLLADLLDVMAPGVADESCSAGKHFARRYGFSDKPAMTRLRSLDGSPLLRGAGGGVSDAMLRVDELSNVALPADRVLIVENEVTFLALPRVPDAIAFFGSGFDVLRLGRLPWLHDQEVVYWGDLDTDGFVILDRLRALLPRVRSILMDVATLVAHQSQWTTDPKPSRVELERLTPDEHAVFRQLRDNSLGTSVRLEQERIRYDRVVGALSALWPR